MQDEAPVAYSVRLLKVVNSLDASGNLKLIDANPATDHGKFNSHAQPFRFGPLELAGFRAFSPAPRPKRLPPPNSPRAVKAMHCMSRRSRLH
ncbi:MAG: hypothetical protein IPJ98_15435 [Bryobacterales bacterium]|nr:hypothetical protein [Bryobacterales bacterium]